MRRIAKKWRQFRRRVLFFLEFEFWRDPLFHVMHDGLKGRRHRRTLSTKKSTD
jgi:hypothetical protein